MPDADRKDRFAHLTDSQRDAVCSVGRSLLVSAAAGAGKTTVLAERCAYLVCDLPPEHRCDIDQLLVVTFTDAAAAEMRSRIRSAIRKRREDSPDRNRLDRQLHLLDSASISTIHSFCKSLIQQWFPQANVDPQAAVLAEDEADLLRREVLDALFVELYGDTGEYGRSFLSLVDDYGAGNDRMISEALLSIHGFACSLPDPQAWLRRSAATLDPAVGESLACRIDDLQRGRLTRELEHQIEQSRENRCIIESLYPAASIHGNALHDHQAQCEFWLGVLRTGGARAWEVVAGEIAQYKITTGRKPSKNKISESESAEYDAAKELVERQRKLLDSRIQKAICGFTAEEYREGLQRIRPYVTTIVRILEDFDDRYRQAKAVQAAVDFNDLQRQAYLLLTQNGAPTRPSEVALRLQQRYRHVLVDEFQDVDPLQEAILRMVSRETADPPEGNLFAVGDIKQSIYRFRLAEPGLFTRRADEFNSESPLGRLICLQDNFRSRRGIIDAVNLVFEPLMSRSFGGSDYGNDARLHAGASYPTQDGTRSFDGPAVELHLVEPVTTATESADSHADPTDDSADTVNDQDDLDGIQREAYLIGLRIQDWMGASPGAGRMHVADKPALPGAPPALRPIEYRDIVILLRSMPHKAEPIADILRRMGIPVLIGRGDSGADSTEFRDILNLLQVLDNGQQDIPLAAVLRSPLVGEPLTETQLLIIRLADKDAPFHQAVAEYADRGEDAELRQRLTEIRATLDRWRTRIRRNPVAEVLWEILEETHYAAFVAGLPDGSRRRERLIQFHDLAREFGQFRRQGLRRFLRFLEEMLDADRPPRQAVGAGGDDNAVRIMTVHTSKGLEFPVVILADLAKAFNLADAKRTIQVHRKLGIALLAADPDRRIYYPTLIHQLAAEDNRKESLSEELRILYVALTRAREHLVLIGRVKTDSIAAFRVPREPPAGLPHLQLETANQAIVWLLSAIGAAPLDFVRWPGDKTASKRPLIEIREYLRQETDAWRTPPAVVPERAEALARLAALQPMPDEEPLAASDEADRLITSLDTLYPALELTTLPARVSVTELKRRWEASVDPQDRPTTPFPKMAPPSPTALASSPQEAVHRGLATHRFCQLIDLARLCDADDLTRQREELAHLGRLSPQEAAAVLVEDVAWFFTTPLGRHIQANSPKVRREVAFVSRILPEHYDSMVTGYDTRDVILMRGTVDLLLCHDDHLDIVDFKTDTLLPEECQARAADYRAQIDSYSKAMHDIFGRKVSSQWLVFLHPRCIIELPAERD